MNNHLKKNGAYLARTMRRASDVQSRYFALGAPWTQNVRNPLPMHQLVLTALPVLPSPNAVIPVKKTIRTTALGKTSVRHIEEKQYAFDALGIEHYESKGVSVDDVVQKLRAKGFIAMRGTVAMALNQAAHNGVVESIQSRKVEGKLGRPTSRYFVSTHP